MKLSNLKLGETVIISVLRKCAEDDTKPGRAWCVYKEGHPADKQPKGWPKTYETKEDAAHGIKMMKTFGK